MDKKGKFSFVSIDEIDDISVEEENKSISSSEEIAPKKRGRKKKTETTIKKETVSKKTTKKKNSKEDSVEELSGMFASPSKYVGMKKTAKININKMNVPEELLGGMFSDPDSYEGLSKKKKKDIKEELTGMFSDPDSYEGLSKKKKKEVKEELTGMFSDPDNYEGLSKKKKKKVKEELTGMFVDPDSYEGLGKSNSSELVEVFDLPISKELSQCRDNIENNEVVPKKETTYNETTAKKKFYFSFEARLITMITSIVLFFALSCVFMVKAMDFVVLEKVSYSEKSGVQYQVCLKENNFYGDNCLKEGLEYKSNLVDDIQASFRYETRFSSDVSYKGHYSIVIISKIVNSANHSKVLYENEEILVGNKEINSLSNSFVIDETVNIDYKKYNATVSEYKKKLKEEVVSSLEAILYIEDGNETRNVASIDIPLMSDNFRVGKLTLSNNNRSLDVYKNEWNSNCSFYAIISVVSALIAIIILFRTTKLVLKVTTNRNKYQKRLSEIMRNYDRLIVIARSGYVSNGEKEVVKVSSFTELLDARDALEKPIIYSRVNDIKSEFIVEDEDKIYKYVLKEADL